MNTAHGGFSFSRKSLPMRVVSLLVGLALCLLPATGRAVVLLNETFDELTPQESATSVGMFNAIGGTNVDIVGGLHGSFDPALCVSPESGNCVDMDGTGGNPQGVLQSTRAITLTPGITYLLSFDLIGSQRGNTASTTVTFGPYDQTFNLTSNDDTSGIVSNAVITVALTTTAFLTFTSNTPGLEGDLLDNILVTTESTSVVPEPSTWAILSAALLGFALALYFRRRLRMPTQKPRLDT